MEDLKVGNVVQGIVTGIEKYGIFVKINDKYTGLIHISEIRNSFISDVNKFAKVGENLFVEIKEIDKTKKHANLSVKNLNYRINNNAPVSESVRGFYPLKQQLSSWLNEKLTEYENK